MKSMRTIAAVSMLSFSSLAMAWGPAEQAGLIGLAVGGLIGWAANQPQETVVIEQPVAQPQVIYMQRSAPPVYVQQPSPHVAPMYNNLCPIVNGHQTVPIYKSNASGYLERVGCGYPR